MQVVAGLKKFVTVEELQGRKVCVILNLKTAKLAGQVSEAMILAGSVVGEDGSEIVKASLPSSLPLLTFITIQGFPVRRFLLLNIKLTGNSCVGA